jgi:protease-4
VGSIGVVAGKLSFAESLEQLGIHVESVPGQAGADPTRALLASPLARWDDATRAKLLLSIEGMYDLFLARIAEGRGVETSAIEPAAEGRIMNGHDAQRLGLVDELGGLNRAIELAIEVAGLDPETPIEIVQTENSLLGLLGVDGAHAKARAIEALEREAADRTRRILTGGLMPFREEIAAFEASAAPLLAGERVVLALPFVLAVR